MPAHFYLLWYISKAATAAAPASLSFSTQKAPEFLQFNFFLRVNKRNIIFYFYIIVFVASVAGLCVSDLFREATVHKGTAKGRQQQLF